jgi:hypothetical protein
MPQIERWNGSLKYQKTLAMSFLCAVSLAVTGVTFGASSSIQDVDFKNFAYPFHSVDFPGVPEQLMWLPLKGTRPIALHDGSYKFPCDADLLAGLPKTMTVLGREFPFPYPCSTLASGREIFGPISGLPGTTAIAEVGYHTGGTAHWGYLYVISIRDEKPKVVAWLETGSRADMGLRDIALHKGDLILTVNDPDQRQGDCCSLGTLIYRYRWQGGSFRQIGSAVKATDPPERPH